MKSARLLRAISRPLYERLRVGRFVELLDTTGYYSRAFRTHRRRVATHYRQPMIFMGQVPRSGGTLLTQLLDGHPECLTHPYEIVWASGRRTHWCSFDPAASSDDLYRALYETHLDTFVRQGIPRGPGGCALPFCFDRKLQKDLFHYFVARSTPPRSRRDILDAYHSSVFNAWIDLHGFYERPKKWIVGFTPGLSVDASNIDRFMQDYPDGLYVHICRNPYDWWASAKRHHHYAGRSLSSVVQEWIASLENAMRASVAHRGIWLFEYETLLEDPRAFFEEACRDRLHISFDASLLEPTFNGMSVVANTSHEATGHGIRTGEVGGYRKRLGQSEVQEITRLCVAREEFMEQLEEHRLTRVAALIRQQVSSIPASDAPSLA